MATDTDLANAALNALGQDALPTPLSSTNSTNSKTVQLCRRFLDLAKEQTLRARDWNCVRGRAELALLSVNQSLGEWSYSYRLPVDCLCVRRFISQSMCEAHERFSVEIGSDDKRVIHCNVLNAKIVYTRNITNVEVWDSLLFNTCIQRLAWHLNGPITRDFKMAQMFAQQFQAAWEEAIAVDEGEGNIEILTNSPLIDVRG